MAGANAPQGPGWWQASDGLWYPPQPPTKKKKSGCLKWGLVAAAVVVVLMVAAVSLAADDAADEIEDRDTRIREDAGQPACRVDGLGFMAAEVPVTNRSSQRSNYLISVTFEDADGNQIATSAAAVNALEPGQSTTVEASTFDEPVGEFTCRVVEVERFAD